MKIALPIELDTLHDELEAILKLVQKWETKIKSEPLPVINDFGTEEDLEVVFTAMRGELRLVSRRCEALAEVFDDL